MPIEFNAQQNLNAIISKICLRLQSIGTFYDQINVSIYDRNAQHELSMDPIVKIFWEKLVPF